MRRTALAVVVLVAALLSLLAATAEPARADTGYHNPNAASVIGSSANWDRVWALVNGEGTYDLAAWESQIHTVAGGGSRVPTAIPQMPLSTPGPQTAAQSTERVLTDARAGMQLTKNTWPALINRFAWPVLLGTTATCVGWKIFRVTYRYTRFCGLLGLSTGVGQVDTFKVRPFKWVNASADEIAAGFWRELRFQNVDTSAEYTCMSPNPAAFRAAAALGDVPGQSYTSASTCSGSGAWVATRAQIEARVTQTVNEPYTNQGYDLSETMTPQTKPAAGSPDANQITGVIIQSDPYVADEFCHAIDPIACPYGPATAPNAVPTAVPAPSPSFTPFQLPEPGEDETYGDYITRLREYGWVGTVTTTAEAPLETSADPASAYATAPDTTVTRVGVGLLTPVPLYLDAPATAPHIVGERVPWPANAPTVFPQDVPVTVFYKPPGGSHSVPPPEGGGGSTPVPGPPRIDFTPFHDVSACDKFPIGIFCWAADVIGQFDVAPEAPVFDFHGLAGWGSTHYVVNLDVMDSYMSTLRTLLSWAMWIGAVWWVGANLLGFRAAGDPGEATDEVI
jgi:hypothetical protein